MDELILVVLDEMTMVPYEECMFGVVFFKVDETFVIVKLNDTTFSKKEYDRMAVDSSFEVVVNCTYDGENYEAVMIQLGKTADDFEVAEERCVT